MKPSGQKDATRKSFRRWVRLEVACMMVCAISNAAWAVTPLGIMAVWEVFFFLKKVEKKRKLKKSQVDFKIVWIGCTRRPVEKGKSVRLGRFERLWAQHFPASSAQRWCASTPRLVVAPVCRHICTCPSTANALEYGGGAAVQGLVIRVAQRTGRLSWIVSNDCSSVSPKQSVCVCGQPSADFSRSMRRMGTV